MTDHCLFCDESLEDLGLSFYRHVEAEPDCNYLWQHWMSEIPKDHGGD